MTEIETDPFSISFEDITRARKLYNQTPAGNAALRNSFILSALAVVIILFAENYPPFLKALNAVGGIYLWPAIVLILIVYLLLPLYRQSELFRSLRAKPKPYQNIKARFTDEGVDYIQPDVSTHFTWPYFKSAIADGDLILLVYRKHSYIMIPRRSVSKDQFPVLAQLVGSHVPYSEVNGKAKG